MKVSFAWFLAIAICTGCQMRPSTVYRGDPALERYISIGVSPDAKLIVAGGPDAGGIAAVPFNARVIQELGHEMHVLRPSKSNNTNTIVLDTITGQPLHSYPGGIAVFSPDGSKLLLLNNGYASIWDATDAVCLQDFSYLQPYMDLRVLVYLTHAEFTKDGGHILVAGYAENTFSLLDDGHFKDIKTVREHIIELWSIDSPSATKHEDGSISRTGQVLWWMRHPTSITAAALSKDGTRLLVGDNKGTVSVYSIPFLDVIYRTAWDRERTPRPVDIQSVAAALRDAGYVTATPDRDVVEYSTLKRLEGEAHKLDVVMGFANITWLGFLPDNRIIAAGGVDAPKVWTVWQGNVSEEVESSAAIKQHWKGIESLSMQACSLSPDGSLLAVAANNPKNGDVVVLETKRFSVVQILPHKTWRSCVAFWPDGSKVLSGGGGNDITLWDVKRPK